MIQFFRNRIGRYFVQKQLKSERVVTQPTLSECKKVGVVFYLSDEEQYKNVQLLKKLLKQKSSKLEEFSVVGIKRKKKLPEFYSEKDLKKEMHIVPASDFGFFYKPKIENKKLSTFLNKNFDFLVDLTGCEQVIAQRLIVQSKALFKIGQYSELNEVFFDFMIQTEATEGKKYVTELVRYLDILRAPKRAS